jgi:hypothetical protein
MSVDRELPSHTSPEFYHQVSSAIPQARYLPDEEEIVQAQEIYMDVRHMTAEERRDRYGKRGVSAAIEQEVHYRAFGVAFSGPLDVSFKQESHGGKMSELRLSFEEGEGIGETMHRAFRSFPFPAEKYRKKYTELLAEQDERKQREERQEKWRRERESRRAEREKELAVRAKKSFAVGEEEEERAATHGWINSISGGQNVRVRSVEPSQDGRGFDFEVEGASGRETFAIISMLSDKTAEPDLTIQEVYYALKDAGESDVAERFLFLFEGLLVDSETDRLEIG